MRIVYVLQQEIYSVKKYKIPFSQTDTVAFNYYVKFVFSIFLCFSFFVTYEIAHAYSSKLLQEIYGGSSLSKTCNWYKILRKGRDIVDNLSHSEYPWISLTEDEAHELKICHESIRSTLLGNLDFNLSFCENTRLL